LSREALYSGGSTNNKFFTLTQSETIFAPRRKSQKAIL
jgi:hypothetical protein